MLSYPVAEAEELLEGKLGAAKESLENCEEDLDFLRQQITVSPQQAGETRIACIGTQANGSQTLEVNTARMYNWEVAQKRKEREAGGGAGK